MYDELSQIKDWNTVSFKVNRAGFCNPTRAFILHVFENNNWRETNTAFNAPTKHQAFNEAKQKVLNQSRPMKLIEIPNQIFYYATWDDYVNDKPRTYH